MNIHGVKLMYDLFIQKLINVSRRVLCDVAATDPMVVGDVNRQHNIGIVCTYIGRGCTDATCNI